MLLTLLGLAPVPACSTKPKAQQAEIDIDLERFVVGDDGEYALGGEQALVTIVIWSDYACVPCGRTWQVMKHLVEDYGDDVRVVFRAGTVPGFAHGERAAEAAFAAGGQGQFWAMHWRLFEHPEDFSRPILRKHAEAIGLDVPQFMDDLDTGRFAAPRIRDRRAAAELGISALPVAFCNGLYVLGFRDEAGWHALIDREIASARKMMQDGIKRADVYAEFMRTAKRGSVGENDEARALREQRAAAAAAEDPTRLAHPKFDVRYAIPTGAPGFGPEDAPVVVVEFVDYQCPYCRKAHDEVLPVLRETYPQDVRVEIRHLPLEIHPAAAAAARAAITAAEQGEFMSFHDRLFAVERGGLGFALFLTIATDLGLDVEQFKRDFQTREVGDKLAADVLLSRRLGITGTPGFFVNGRYIDGAHSAATYTDMIDEELARAQQLAAAGTPRAQLRAALMQGALEPDQFPNAHLAVAQGEPRSDAGASQPSPGDTQTDNPSQPDTTPSAAQGGQP